MMGITSIWTRIDDSKRKIIQLKNKLLYVYLIVINNHNVLYNCKSYFTNMQTIYMAYLTLFIQESPSDFQFQPISLDKYQYLLRWRWFNYWVVISVNTRHQSIWFLFRFCQSKSLTMSHQISLGTCRWSKKSIINLTNKKRICYSTIISIFLSV